MSKVRCAFCREIGDRAVEHVWPRWLQEFVGGDTKGTHTGVHVRESSDGPTSIGPLEIISRRKQSGESLVYGEICRTCNNGWMNDLECSAAPVLKQLLSGDFDTGQWDSPTSALVAQWAFKTGLMINGSSNYRRLIPPEHFHRFHESGKPPSNVTVDVALNATPKVELCWGQGQVYGVVRRMLDTSFRPEHRENAYTIVISLKHLLLRMCYWPHDNCEVFPNPERTFHRIWPYSADVPFNFTERRTTLEQFMIGTIVYDQI